MKNTLVFDKDLNPVLEIADKDDLEPLVDYVADKISESLTDSDAYKIHYPEHTQYADLIAREIRLMGGNSFANIFRGEGPTYYEIVCDVAKKLEVPFNENRTIDDVEDAILETILKKALDHMSDDERSELLEAMGSKGGLDKGGITTAAFIAIFRAGGFYSYQLTLIIANQIARIILGHGLRIGTNAALTRTVSILTGPIGWAITGIWTAIDVAGPSFKVTIPCVIHVAMLRKKLNALSCKECNAILPDTTVKFCPECGNKMQD